MAQQARRSRDLQPKIGLPVREIPANLVPAQNWKVPAPSSDHHFLSPRLKGLFDSVYTLNVLRGYSTRAARKPQLLPARSLGTGDAAFSCAGVYHCEPG